MTHEVNALVALARLRWRMAVILSLLVVGIYFGFILSIAFHKGAMGALVAPGLSIGIVAGAMVIVLTWAITWFYVRWANLHVDGEVERQNRSAS